MADGLINLLPIELSTSSTQAKLASIVKKISIGSSLLYTLVAFASLAYLITLSVDLKQTTQRTEDLRTKILDQQQAEQKFILISDRIQRAKTIYAKSRDEEIIQKIQSFSANLPPTLTLIRAEIDINKTEATLNALSSKDLSIYLSQLASSSSFEKVVLENFSFNPTTGYTISLNFN